MNWRLTGSSKYEHNALPDLENYILTISDRKSIKMQIHSIFSDRIFLSISDRVRPVLSIFLLIHQRSGQPGRRELAGLRLTKVNSNKSQGPLTTSNENENNQGERGQKQV